MTIKNLITHRIVRTTPSEQTQIQLRKSMLAIDGKAEELCREIKHTYIRKSGKIYGGFSDNSAEYPVANWLKEYLGEKISFETFVSHTINNLKYQVDKTECTLDNLLVVFHEVIEAGESVYLCLIDHTRGQYFDGDLDLSDSLYIDTQNIYLAARVKSQEFISEDNYNYLSMLRWRGEKELSDAFSEFLGIGDKVDIATETTEFLDAVSAYTKDLPEDIAKQTKSTMVDYCLEQDKSGSPIAVKGLSEHISIDNQPDFSTFIKTVQPKAKEELIPDKTQLRNYIRISGRNELMSMSFASAALGESIVYDTESDSITIKNIPSSLKAKLLKHLQKE